jgi:betaine-aldehyde dehydrogenase
MTEVLNQIKELIGKQWIDNTLRQGTGPIRYEVIDPSSEEVIAHITEATSAEVDASVESAARAQKIWWRKSALNRCEIMHEIADRMKEMKPRLAELLTREMGKPFKETSDEVDWSISAIRYYAEIGRSDMGRVMGPAVAGQMHYTLKLPLGVVASIQPFNYPILLLCWQAGPGLAAGNAFVVKPSEHTSLTTLLLAECFAVLPKGLFQVVCGGGTVGKQLVEHKKINMVAFTGSVPTGELVGRTCGEMMKPMLIEASGNDPFIVMPSAPVDIAARAATFAAFMNCGQICTSAERFYVHEGVHDSFVEKLVAGARSLRIGNGLGKVDLGPMVSAKERDRIEGIIAKAVAQGARLATGGGRPKGMNRGFYLEPTVLTDCKPSMDIFHNESFGPVAPICKVSGFDEALALANDSKYGLGATIYTTDLNETMRAAEELETGMLWVNAPLLDNDAGPFGGIKKSGIGRELGPEGLETFRQTKLVMIDPTCSVQDFWWFPYKDEEAYAGK